MALPNRPHEQAGSRDASDTTLVTLRLVSATDTISGTVADEHGDERAFWGWLELSGALDELRGAEPDTQKEEQCQG